MDDSDSSSLSSAPEEEIQKLAPIFLKAKKATKVVAPPPKPSPPRPKREPSPPHEEVFADNPDIAFIVMFRSRFHAAFPPKLAHYGPQDIERGVFDTPIGPQVEALLCALLALVLNRKKPVEQGHYGRALEEAVQTHKSQWPHRWQGINPLHGPRDFTTMTPEERLFFLRTLIMWSTNSSEVISNMIKDNYKQSRHSDDENQPLSLQPWGRDGDKRRYFLVEGQDDTSFRVYREGHRYNKHPHWWSMAGDIDEIRKLAERLEKEDASQAARTLSQRMLNAIPRFEATEEKRRRREYRQMRRAAFTRPEPGYSLYEGRTRGKRMRYTYDDDDGFLSDDTSNRRSGRQSERNTPFDSGPVTTMSGRQVKPRRGGEYGASLLSGQVAGNGDTTPGYDEERDGTEDSEPTRGGGRARRSFGRPSVNGINNPRKRKFVDNYNEIDDMSDEAEVGASGDEWDSDANDHDDHDMPDADDEDDGIDDDDEGEEDEELKSLVVKLRVSPKATKPLKEVIEDKQTAAFDSTLPRSEPPQSAGPKPGQIASEPIESQSAQNTPTVPQPAQAQSLASGYPTPASLPPVFKGPDLPTASLPAPSTNGAANSITTPVAGRSSYEQPPYSTATAMPSNLSHEIQ